MGMLKQMLRQLLGNRIVTCLHAKKTKWAMSLYGEKAVAEFDAIIRNQNSLTVKRDLLKMTMTLMLECFVTI